MSTGTLISLDELLLGRRGSRIGTPELKLPSSVMRHTPLDSLEFEDFVDSSPRFREICVDNAPQIPVDAHEPPALDLAKATPGEFIAYQEALRAAREAIENAPPYDAWDKLTRDTFFSYHTRDVPHVTEDAVDPGVELHRRIMPQVVTTDDHDASRRRTRNNAPMAAIATMAFVSKLRELLGDELLDQAKESQEYRDKVREIEHEISQLEDMREEARELAEAGDEIPESLKDAIRAAVKRKRDGQGQAFDMAQSMTPMSKEAKKAIAEAAKHANSQVENGGAPGFGSGFGQGEPVYESPEQALSIAKMWAENERLRKMAALFGRLDPDISFQRSKRVEHGNDEIVDVKFGDNLRRILPAELALLGSGDEEMEMDFLARFADAELLEFSTIGEEHAGRGPVGLVIDGSYSMNGDRTIWARAIAMCLLHICRLEKRDFFAVEFADMGDCEMWVFPAREPLDPQRIIDMASHFFGGGTNPIQGVAKAATYMQEAPLFKKADMVLIGDGDAGFGNEDRKLRDRLKNMGVRLWGIAIGESHYRYLTEYCEAVVHVHDFELTDPSAATSALATQIS